MMKRFSMMPDASIKQSEMEFHKTRSFGMRKLISSRKKKTNWKHCDLWSEISRCFQLTTFRLNNEQANARVITKESSTRWMRKKQAGPIADSKQSANRFMDSIIESII